MALQSKAAVRPSLPAWALPSVTLEFRRNRTHGRRHGQLYDSVGCRVDTTSANASGILGGYATVSGMNWAAVTSGADGALASYDSFAVPGTNANINAAITDSAISATSINSLRFNSAGSYSLTLGSSLTIQSGGILVTSGVGSNPVAIGGAGLTSGNSLDLIVVQNNMTGAMTIFSTDHRRHSPYEVRKRDPEPDGGQQ